QDLQGDQLTGAELARLVDGAEPALSELGDDLVATLERRATLENCISALHGRVHAQPPPAMSRAQQTASGREVSSSHRAATQRGSSPRHGSSSVSSTAWSSGSTSLPSRRSSSRTRDSSRRNARWWLRFLSSGSWPSRTNASSRLP